MSKTRNVKCQICDSVGHYIDRLCYVHRRLKRMFPKEFKKLERNKISNL